MEAWERTLLNALGLTQEELIQMEYPSSKRIENEFMNDPRINYFINAKLP